MQLKIVLASGATEVPSLEKWGWKITKLICILHLRTCTTHVYADTGGWDIHVHL